MIKTKQFIILFCCFLGSSSLHAKVIKKQEDRRQELAWNIFKTGAGIYVFYLGFEHSHDTLNTVRAVRLKNVGSSLGMIAKKTGVSVSLLTAGYLTGKNGMSGLKKNWIGL